MGSAVAASLILILETGIDEWSASRLAALIPEKEPSVDVMSLHVIDVRF